MSSNRARVAESILQFIELVEKFIDVGSAYRLGSLNDVETPEGTALDKETAEAEVLVMTLGEGLIDQLVEIGEDSELMHRCLAMTSEDGSESNNA